MTTIERITALEYQLRNTKVLVWILCAFMTLCILLGMRSTTSSDIVKVELVKGGAYTMGGSSRPFIVEVKERN